LGGEWIEGSGMHVLLAHTINQANWKSSILWGWEITKERKNEEQGHFVSNASGRQ